VVCFLIFEDGPSLEHSDELFRKEVNASDRYYYHCLASSEQKVMEYSQVLVGRQ